MAAYDDDEGPIAQTSIPKPLQKPKDPARQQSFSSTGIFSDAIKEGYCLKKGPHKLAGWKKRYLQLTSNKQLGYYTNDSMVKKKGTIWLASRTINHIKRSTKTSDSKHHGFCIITSGRTYQFCVPSSTDRDHWIQKIRETIDDGWDKHKVKGSISYSSSPRHNGFVAPYNQSLSVQPKFDNAYDDDIKSQQKNNKNMQPLKQELEWDDDDEDEQNSDCATLKIAVNILKDKQSQKQFYPNTNSVDSDHDSQEYEDRFAQRSKYQKRNDQENENINVEEIKEQIQELEEKNDSILDNALKTSYETMEIAADTASKLDEQRGQLIGIDKNLHEIDEDLNGTERTLNGMKSFGGMIKNKFKKKKKEKNEYQAPNGKKSTFKRRKKNSGSQSVSASQSQSMTQQNVVSEYEADNVQNAKLDELLKNVKSMNAVANDINNELDEQDEIIKSISDKMDKINPRLQDQSETMKKMCQ